MSKRLIPMEEGKIALWLLSSTVIMIPIAILWQALLLQKIFSLKNAVTSAFFRLLILKHKKYCNLALHA